MGPTALQPRLFFSGTWTGSGKVRFRGPLCLLRRPERFSYSSSGRWTSEVRRGVRGPFAVRVGCGDRELSEGRTLGLRLRCHDVTEVDDSGLIHNRTEMSWLRLPVTTLTMQIHAER